MAERGIRVMPAGEPVIFSRHCSTPLFIMKDMFDIGDHFGGQAAVHLDHVKTFGLDIFGKYFIAIDQQRPVKVYGFKQSIAKALIQAGIGYEIGCLVDVPKGEVIT